MKKALLILLMALNTGIQAQSVRIAAAANLRYILDAIKGKYVKISPNADISINLNSSGALYQQIVNGANFDIFLAADKSFPEKLKEQNLVTGEVKIYGYGKLVLYSSTIDLSKGIDILNDPSIVRIAIAKPEVAPYGDRAIQCLKYYNLLEKVKGKIVYADNIAQAAQFTQTGNAEIGFLALAMVVIPEMKGTYLVLDTKSYKPVEQAMVLLKRWEPNPEAAKFMKFVLSAECHPIFEEFGFVIP